MKESWRNATFTTEFGQEFEAERSAWLRRRFLWYTGSIGTLNACMAVFFSAAILVFVGAPPEDRLASWVGVSVHLLTTALYLGAFAYVRRVAGPREQPTQIAYWLILANGVLRLVAGIIAVRIAERVVPGLTAMQGASVGSSWAAGVFTTHLFACMFLPWTPKESIRPLIPLVGLNALMALLSSDPWVQKVISIVAFPLVGVPGAMICWWRHSRFRDRFTMRMLRGKYHEMRRELVDARRIHEALFPQPRLDGPILFDYRYEPMRHIGGDYLYCKTSPSGTLSVVLIDVTGHGIPAALTVNRLHGELERIFAENADARPGDVLSLLNRYVHLTLATHSVYVTALCLRADPARQELEYASGGHPPAFLRAVDGTIDQLDSTAFVLGACPSPEFDPEPRTLRFGPGDALVAYTDGATEARDTEGRMIGIKGLRRIIATGRPAPGGGWPLTVLAAVEDHRQGAPDDDTLVVELRYPLASERAAAPANGKHRSQNLKQPRRAEPPMPTESAAGARES